MRLSSLVGIVLAALTFTGLAYSLSVCAPVKGGRARYRGVVERIDEGYRFRICRFRAEWRLSSTAADGWDLVEAQFDADCPPGVASETCVARAWVEFDGRVTTSRHCERPRPPYSEFGPSRVVRAGIAGDRKCKPAE